MKLAIATAVLASAFPTIAGSAQNGQQQQQQRQQQQLDELQKRQRALQKLQQLRSGRSAPSSSSVNESVVRVDEGPSAFQSRKLLEWKIRGGHSSGQLKNANELSTMRLVNSDQPQECDPTQHHLDDGMGTMDDIGDVGILSCGIGEYCREVEGSRLGGLCAALDTSHQRRTAKKHSSLLGGNRAFDLGGDGPSLMDAVSYACEKTDYCDCTRFDFEDLEGIIECTNLDNYCSNSDNYCNENVELCFSVTSTLSVRSRSDFTYTECIFYTKPYQQKVCSTYDTDAPESCNLEFNNEVCQSCKTQLRIYDETYLHDGTNHSYSYNKRCFEFDCTGNNGAEHKGNSCDRDIATIGYNVVFGDECARCLTCGLGYKMTKGSVIQNFPLIGEYRCDGLELASLLGFFEQDACHQIQEAAFEPCGCEPIFYDPLAVRPDGGLSVSPSLSLSMGPSTTPSSVASAPPSLPASASPSAGPSVGPSAVLSAAPTITQTASQRLETPKPTTMPTGSMAVPSSAPSISAESSQPTTDAGVERLSPDIVFSCNACGPNATIADEDLMVPLSNGATSCGAFHQAGLAGVFTEEFCNETVIPLVELHCGCIVTSTAEPTSEPPKGAGPLKVDFSGIDFDGPPNTIIPPGELNTTMVPSNVPSLTPSAAPSPLARPLVNEILSTRAEEIHNQPPDEDGFGQPDTNSGTAQEELLSSSDAAPTILGWKSTTTVTAVSSVMLLLSMLSVCL